MLVYHSVDDSKSKLVSLFTLYLNRRPSIHLARSLVPQPFRRLPFCSFFFPVFCCPIILFIEVGRRVSKSLVNDDLPPLRFWCCLLLSSSSVHPRFRNSMMITRGGRRRASPSPLQIRTLTNIWGKGKAQYKAEAGCVNLSLMRQLFIMIKDLADLGWADWEFWYVPLFYFGSIYIIGLAAWVCMSNLSPVNQGGTQ